VKIKTYFSLVKFSHTIFAMPFALIGYFLAAKITYPSLSQIDWKLFVMVILCMVFARNSAMGFNRYADRAIDTKNPRTQMREIPSGKVLPSAALTFVIINCLLFVVTTFFINRLVFFLSPIALIVVLGYSFTKRFTALCHFVLGVGLSLAPIGAYLSVNGHFAVLPVLISFIVLLWVGGFDVIYALQDEPFDKSEQLKSVPVFFGIKNALRLSVVVHLVAALLVVVVGLLGSFGILFWIGSAVFIGLLVYQHILVKPDDLSKVNLAFGTTNGIASVVFAAFVIMDIIFK